MASILQFFCCYNKPVSPSAADLLSITGTVRDLEEHFHSVTMISRSVFNN